jgi:ATP adenylyltransferase
MCEFCNPKNIQKQECAKVSSDKWMVLISKYPYADGNLMIIPRRHVTSLEAITPEEWADLRQVLLRTKVKLGKIFKTNDFNFGINLGKLSGTSIDHIHWQLIPRTKRVGNFLSLIGDIHVISLLPEDLRKRMEK